MFGGKMATTPSWLSCLKPHVSWVFGQLRHFNFSGPGATHREARKSFASFFKSCGVWGSAPRSRGCKGRRSRLPARSALDGAHRAPAPLPSPTSKKGGRMSPSWGGTEPGGGTVLAENLRRAYGSVREPPTRVPCEKTSAGSLFYPPAFAGGEEGRGTLSHTLPPLKRWAKLLLVSLKPKRGHKS